MRVAPIVALALAPALAEPRLQRSSPPAVGGLGPGLNPAVQQSVPVAVALDAAVFTTSDRFMSVAIDQGALVKPEQWDLWSQQMSSPKFTAVCQMLRPAFVRIGGTASATITYDMEATPVIPALLQQAHPTGHGGYTPEEPYRMGAEQWGAVCNWTAQIGWPIVFGINLLSNRTGGPNHTDHWVADNAVSLIAYTSTHHAGAVAGWELGNEPEGWLRNFGFSLSNDEIAADFARLRSLLRSEFSASNYLIFGPDQGIQGCLKSDSCTKYAELVATLVREGSIDASTFHFCKRTRASTSDPCCAVLPPADPELVLIRYVRMLADNMGKDVLHPKEEAALFTQPRSFDLTRAATTLAVNATRRHSPPRNGATPVVPVWLGETATASGGGLRGSSGTYTATLLFLDKLGSVGRWGGAGLMRQALFAGQYALLDPATYLPRPTFWVAAIFTQLAGTRVLSVEGDLASNRTLRLYSRCAEAGRYKPGAVVVFGGKSIPPPPPLLVAAGLRSQVQLLLRRSPNLSAAV
jgi:hypothetical protein